MTDISTPGSGGSWMFHSYWSCWCVCWPFQDFCLSIAIKTVCAGKSQKNGDRPQLSCCYKDFVQEGKSPEQKKRKLHKQKNFLFVLVIIGAFMFMWLGNPPIHRYFVGKLPYTIRPDKKWVNEHLTIASLPFPSIQNSCSTSSTIIVARLSILRPLRDLAMVGWSMSTRMKVRLVCDALQMAVWQRQP